MSHRDILRALVTFHRLGQHGFGVCSEIRAFRQTALEGLGMTLPDVYKLIDRDSGEELDFGQTVRNTFPLADFFLRVDTVADKKIKEKLRRFLSLAFDTEIITPSSAETAMYFAASAAGNSACLSRQIGAALTDKDGEIIAVGWNDVPCCGGGLYREDSSPDERCLNRGEGACANDHEKELLINDIARELIDAKIVSPENKDTAAAVLRQSKIKDLIEFSRAAHAEMHALILGSQLGGNRVKGGKLFCTTYPCHACATHIILAGVKEVYYIEPYRKSRATKLHDDAITENESDITRVRILLFDGVAPARYLELFRMKLDSRKEKGEGKRRVANKKEALPKSEVSLESLPALEALVVHRLVTVNAIEANR